MFWVDAALDRVNLRPKLKPPNVEDKGVDTNNCVTCKGDIHFFPRGVLSRKFDASALLHHLSLFTLNYSLGTGQCYPLVIEFIVTSRAITFILVMLILIILDIQESSVRLLLVGLRGFALDVALL